MRSDKMYYVIALIGITLLLLVITAHARRDRFLDRTIKGVTTLTPEWIEIKPQPPLNPERDEQVIALYLQEPYVGDFETKGVLTPDGSIGYPEVQLIDVEGNTFTLKFAGFRGRELIYFTLWKQLKDRKYQTVRIRANKNIKCKEIIWSCYNWKDIK